MREVTEHDRLVIARVGRQKGKEWLCKELRRTKAEINYIAAKMNIRIDKP